MSESKRLHPLAAEARIAYVRGISWILAHQRKDGSWGSNPKYKVTYTAQAIQLLLKAGFAETDMPLRKALRWMDECVDQSDPHWYSKVELDLILGDVHKAVSRGKLRTFVEDVTHDLENPSDHYRVNFFWHVLPILIALEPHEPHLRARNELPEVPHQRVRERLFDEAIEYGTESMAVRNSPNHTGLSALYLKGQQRRGLGDFTSEVGRLTNWLFQTRVVTKEHILWANSRGITAYVLIDFLALFPESVDNPIEPMLPQILGFLKPDKDGKLPGDKLPTFDTALHKEGLYATILCLRALATVVDRYEPQSLGDLRADALTTYRKRPLSVRFKTFYYRRKWAIPWLVPTAIAIPGAIMAALGNPNGWSVIFMAGGSVLGSLASYVGRESNV